MANGIIESNHEKMSNCKFNLLTITYQKMPGISVQVNDNCIGCGVCVDACIYDGVVLDGDVVRITESCRACGRCVQACPNNSIEISVTDDTYVQQTIAMLSQHVDVS